MKKFGYSDALATGAIASGGTLGILIPPSTIMVIYGIMTGTSIGKLFAAGILPGILAALLLCLAVQYVTWRDPKAGPRGERLPWKERFATATSKAGAYEGSVETGTFWTGVSLFTPADLVPVDGGPDAVRKNRDTRGSAWTSFPRHGRSEAGGGPPTACAMLMQAARRPCSRSAAPGSSRLMSA